MQYDPQEGQGEQPTPAQLGEEPEYEGFDFEKYKAFWREWVDVFGPARKQCFRDQEYYDGDVEGNGWGQWTTEELRKLTERNQPPTTRNHVARKVHAVAGVEQRARAEPRAYPRTPKDQRSSEIATDSLRFAKERARLNVTSQFGMLDLLIAGYCGSEVDGAEDAVKEAHIEWRDLAFDPRSRRHDFSDARWIGTGKWIDADAAVENYAGPEIPPPQIPPKPLDPMMAQQWAMYAQAVIARYQQAVAKRQRVIDAIEKTAAGSRGADLADNDDYDDHPIEQFGDPKRKRIFVVDMWHRDPKHGWYRCVFTGVDKLFTEAATLVEQDDWGRKVKVPPLKLQSLFVSKKGYRYGLVRAMRSPQDEVNFRLSKALHWLMVNQILVERGALGDGDVDRLRREAARPDGALVVNNLAGVRIERGLDIAGALKQMQADAEMFLDSYGPNPQLQGEQGRATSGRAVLALQQAGLGQLGPIFDRFHDWEDRRYRSYWHRIQQFWTGPMYVRVTDDKNAARFAAVNGARVVQSHNGTMPSAMGAGLMSPSGMMMQPGGSDMLGHNGGPPMDQEDFGPMLAEIDVDIIIDRAPEAATLQAEQYEALVQLAQAGVMPPGPQTARMLITASSLPNKSELLDMLDKMEKQAGQAQQPNPAQLAELKKLIAQAEDLMAARDKKRAETEKIKAEIPGVHAETTLTAAQARTENLAPTMPSAQSPGAGGFAFDNLAPPVAPAPQGALGLSPIETNGPPPFLRALS